MHQKNRGGALAEVISIIVMLGIIFLGIIIIIPALSVSKCTGRYGKCKANLTQFRTALTMYQLDFGRQLFYPQKQGQGFIASLYKYEFLVEEFVYLCPLTEDSNSGEDLANAAESGNDRGPISYAGRINTDQTVYPGFFKLNADTSTTPMISDDLPDNKLGNYNHEKIHLLFLDGHIGETSYRFVDTLLPSKIILTKHYLMFFAINLNVKFC